MVWRLHLSATMPPTNGFCSFLLMTFALTACNDEVKTLEDAGEVTGTGLPTLNESDSDRALRGETFLHNEWPGRATLPKLALDNLWLVWGDGPVTEVEKWQQIEQRYGLFRAAGQPWPVGLPEVDANNLSYDCLLCHASEGTRDGEVWIGIGNNRLDLERFYSDIKRLAAIAEQAGLGTIEIPTQLDGVSQAPGATDGIGLGMLFAGTIDELGETFGYQQASAFWTMQYKERLYSDGAGRVDNWRTMMSTLFSFGMTQAEIQSYDGDFEDLRHYFLSLKPPVWPYPQPSPSDVVVGQSLFNERCASCHGVYDGVTAFPDRVVATSVVGTDAVRELGMDDFQVGVINGSWYGEPAAWEETDGYLATPLIGVWATAPYFHNGSVPNLLGVLDSTQRPNSWWYASEYRYDPDVMGWAYAESGESESEYDTEAFGLSNKGHTYGDSFSEQERESLMSYLKTL